MQTGWGEAHELGHNMQDARIKIFYVPPGAGNIDDYSKWQDRSGENSNNIFPYYILWYYYRYYRGYSGSATDDHMIGKDAFGALQSSWANLSYASDPTTLVVFNGDCSKLGSFASSTPEASNPELRHYSAVYKEGGYAPNNGHRMTFFLQLPLILAAFPTCYGGVQLTSGWPIFTLLYQGTRQLYAWGGSGNSTLWESKRSLLGLDLFPMIGGDPGVPYSSDSTVTSMRGNDFIVILLSFIVSIKTN